MVELRDNECKQKKRKPQHKDQANHGKSSNGMLRHSKSEASGKSEEDGDEPDTDLAIDVAIGQRTSPWLGGGRYSGGLICN